MSVIIPQLLRNVCIRQSQTATYSTIKTRCHTQIIESSKKLKPFQTLPSNQIHTSNTLDAVRDFKPGAGRRVILGLTPNYSPSKLRGPIYDESDNTKDTLSALESAHDLEEIEGDSLYPDETTADKLFDGIK